MATVADLYGIPETLPELADLDLSSRVSLDRYAIYFTVSISTTEVNALVSAINTPIESRLVNAVGLFANGPARVAPQADFAGKSLQDVVNHHKEAIIAGDDGLKHYHPLSIIAITNTDWRTHGVLLISLYNCSPSGRGYVFAFPHPALQAASVLADIEVGNTSWEEACDAAGVDIPELPAFMTTFEPSALDNWNVDEMGAIAWYNLHNPSEPYSQWEALNGGPTCWDRPNGGISSCPCQPPGWLHSIGESYAPDASTDVKIAAIVVGHQEKHQRWKDANPNQKKYTSFHDRIIVISDHEDFKAEGVLVGEITEDGKDIVLERVAVKNVVEVLVSKVGGDAAGNTP